MKKVIIKFKNNSLFTFILGMILCSGIVYAATYYAKDVTYTPGDKTWNVSNVNEAIDSLYDGFKNLNSPINIPILEGHSNTNNYGYGAGVLIIDTTKYSKIEIDNVQLVSHGSNYATFRIQNYETGEELYNITTKTTLTKTDIVVDITNVNILCISIDTRALGPGGSTSVSSLSQATNIVIS